LRKRRLFAGASLSAIPNISSATKPGTSLWRGAAVGLHGNPKTSKHCTSDQTSCSLGDCFVIEREQAPSLQI
jgi:hypothetical protein